jgi:HD-like signal output (HDOD) protein
VEVQVAEQRIFGATHADVGGYLIGLWGLSVPVLEAVTFHHKPIRATQITFSPLTCVHAANVIEAENATLDGRGRAAELDTSYLTRLGLLSRVSAWRDARGAD